MADDFDPTTTTARRIWVKLTDGDAVHVMPVNQTVSECAQVIGGAVNGDGGYVSGLDRDGGFVVIPSRSIAYVAIIPADGDGDGDA